VYIDDGVSSLMTLPSERRSERIERWLLLLLTGFFILFGLLLLALGHFIAADLSDLEFARRPENKNYD